MEVLAQFMRHSFPRSLTLRQRFSQMYLQASRQAILYPLIMLVGCNFQLISSFAFLSNSDAIITTEVVPSPTSLSCNCDNCTITFAAGCSTSNYLKIVAPLINKIPSLVMVMSPMSSTNILSSPHGPKVFFTILAMAKIAVTNFRKILFEFRTS